MANNTEMVVRGTRRPYGAVSTEVRERFANLRPYDRLSRAERFIYRTETDGQGGLVRGLQPLQDAWKDAVRTRVADYAPDVKQMMVLTPLAYEQASEKILGHRAVGEFLARQPASIQSANWTWGLANRAGSQDRRPLQFRMVRDNICRAVLSESYQPFDDIDLVATLDEALSDMPEYADAQVVLSSFDDLEQRSEFRLVFPQQARELKAGDVVEAGIIMRNTATSGVSVQMLPYLNRLVCSNGMRGPAEIDASFRLPHLTSADRMRQFLRDALEGLSGKWDAITGLYRDAMKHHIESPTGVFRQLERDFRGALTSEDVNRMLDAFTHAPGDGSLFDISMAVSQYAQTKVGDERLEVERIAGSLLTSMN